MKKIKDLRVIIGINASNFEDCLNEQVNKMQKQGLEVTINNPSIILHNPYQCLHYMAVVEGRGEIVADSQFPPFNINPKS